MLAHEINESLMDLVFLGIDYGIDNLRDFNQLMAFVLVEFEEERTLHRFPSERFEESYKQGKDFLQTIENFDYAVLVYDGTFTLEEKCDAVLADGRIKGEPFIYEFAQIYKPKKLFSKVKPIGNVGFVGRN
ncbi:hypothetical protein ACFVHQ_12145 [Actinomycetes bacterium NPDC127524]